MDEWMSGWVSEWVNVLRNLFCKTSRPAQLSSQLPTQRLRTDTFVESKAVGAWSWPFYLHPVRKYTIVLPSHVYKVPYWIKHEDNLTLIYPFPELFAWYEVVYSKQRMNSWRLQMSCTLFNDLVPTSHRTNCLHYKYELPNAVIELNPLSHTKYGNEISLESAEVFEIWNAVVHVDHWAPKR